MVLCSVPELFLDLAPEPHKAEHGSIWRKKSMLLPGVVLQAFNPSTQEREAG